MTAIMSEEMDKKLQAKNNCKEEWRQKYMKNIEMTTEGNILTIKVDLSQRFGQSSSGKSTIIASTEGNQSVPGHEDIKIGLNIYTK